MTTNAAWVAAEETDRLTALAWEARNVTSRFVKEMKGMRGPLRNHWDDDFGPIPLDKGWHDADEWGDEYAGCVDEMDYDEEGDLGDGWRV